MFQDHQQAGTEAREAVADAARQAISRLDKYRTRRGAPTRAVPATETRLECPEARVIGLDEKRRRVKHVISSGTLDRGNRIVEPSGWKLARFKKNPVVLADHDYAIERIIGRAVDTKVEGDALVSTTEFDGEGLGNVAFRLVQAGLAKAWSVGWMGLKSHRIGELEDCERCNALKSKVEWGRHFVRQELLEYSLVAVPANPDAVLGLRAAGLIGSDESDEWAELTTETSRRSTRRSVGERRGIRVDFERLKSILESRAERAEHASAEPGSIADQVCFSGAVAETGSMVRTEGDGPSTVEAAERLGYRSPVRKVPAGATSREISTHSGCLTLSLPPKR